MQRSADVVIVGGGCMGASAAFHLARLGVTNVVVVERDARLGAGSTGRNAGGVRHQFSHEANIRLSMESIRALEQFEALTGQAVDLHQHGYLFLLNSAPTVETFRRNVELQRDLGIPVEWLSADDAARLAPGLDTDGVLAATFCGRDGIADPNGVTMGFAKAAQQMGVAIERNTEVTGVERRAGRITAVTTTRGSISTPIVVNAAGPHARSIGAMTDVDVPVDPYRRHIFITSALPGVPQTRIMVIDFESTFYFHREGAGVLFGMGDPDERPTFDMTVQWDFLPRVIQTAVRRLPALEHAAIAHAWAGLYEVTPDANPLIGESAQPGFYLLTGFSGHGFQHSPAAGRILADLITGRDPGIDLSPFAPGRFAEARSGGERYVV